MNFSIEALFISIGFILPGFLTIKLINSRTPVRSRKSSVFEETSISLLRSFYINLIIYSIFLAIFQYWIIPANPEIFLDDLNVAIKEFININSIRTIWFVLLCLSSSFGLATFFGCFFDPLDRLISYLANKSGSFQRDVLATLTDEVRKLRKDNKKAELWALARMNNNDIYYGEFTMSSYRNEGEPREILLSHVTYQSSTDLSIMEQRDYVFIDFSSCISIEWKIVK